jgi:hypothetical protein
MNREEVYVNNGELWKQVGIFEHMQNSPYIQDNIDPVFTAYKDVDGVVKKYLSTKEFREYLNINSKAPGAFMEVFDLCPSVPLWAGLGAKKGGFYDLYFNCKNSTILKEVAEYYNLPYPISEEMSEILDNNPEKIAAFNKDEDEFILCSLRLEQGKPILLKLHAVYKDKGKYFIFNRGRVFENGKVIEEGAFYKARGLPNLYTSEGDGFTVVYQSSYNNDGIVDFEGIFTYADGSTAVKTYESSREAKYAVANAISGSSFPEYDKYEEINWWLAKSVLKDEIELYFHVTSKEMLDRTCNYYGLPVPYDEELGELLVENPHVVRFKSYDLEKKGPGNFVEILLASVVFKENTATAIRFYETMRPNE